MRLMKSMAYRTDTLLGNDQIKCRMYTGYREAVYGFSKNVVAYFGGSYLFTFGFLLVTSLGWLPFLLNSEFILLYLYFSILIGTRVFVSLASRQSVITNIIYIPIQQLSFLLFVLQSVKNKLTQTYTWKERTI